MRHRKKFNHLSRQSEHRKALLANLAVELLMHKRIKTTTAKAKALKQYVEPLITKGKNDTTHSRRVVFSNLKNKYAVTELFGEIAPKVGDRPGGYTRILKLGNRLGDNAEMCFIELVDYNENMLKETETKKTKKRTRRGGRKKAADEDTTSQVTETTTAAKENPTNEAADQPADKPNDESDKKSDENSQEKND